LKQQYQALLEKARVCDKGSTDECSPSSTLEPLGCGCPVLVNAKSEYVASAKKARQAYQDAKCVDAIACTSVACVPTASASCAQASASGSGSGFVCTAGTVVAN
jgi:hydrogenase maturation factor